MKLFRTRSTALASLAMVGALTLTACSGGDPLASEETDTGASDGSSIIVGAAEFAESQLIAIIYSQALAAEGYDITEKLNIGAREVYMRALEDGSIDLIPDYNGYLIQEYDADADTSDRDDIQEQLLEQLPEGITVLDWAEAEDTNTIVVREDFAEKHGGLKTVSDLAAADDGTFTFAGSAELKNRESTGLPAIKEVYGVDFSNRYQTLDAGGPLSLAAVVNGQADIALLLSSDPAIADNNLVALEDDKVIFPPGNVLPVIREDVLDDTVAATLNAISAKLTTEDLMEMNGRANDGDDLDDIAADWLQSVGLV